MLKPATLATILLAGLIPAAGLLAGGAWPLAAACAGLSGLWLVGCLRGWNGLASWLLVGFVVLAAIGISARGGSLWAPPAVVMALAAWDLQRFMGRAGAINAGDAGRDLTGRHLRRLLAVSGLGLALGWIAADAAAASAAGTDLKLSLGAALALGFLAILGVSLVIRALARESD